MAEQDMSYDEHVIPKAGRGPCHRHGNGEVAQADPGGQVILVYLNRERMEVPISSEVSEVGGYVWVGPDVPHRFRFVEKGGTIYREKSWARFKPDQKRILGDFL